MNYDNLMTAPPVIRDFLTYNETIRGKSARSGDEYYLDLQTFFRYILMSRGKADSEDFEKIGIKDVDIELIKTVTMSDIYAFLVYCKNERGNNTATRARKISTLRIFFKFLTVQTRQLETNPTELLESPKIKQSLPKHLTLDDSLNLLGCVDGVYKERDYCILVFFLNCGMRLSELCGINLSDISSDGALKLLGKGNKERTVYLNDSCKQALEAYLKVRPCEGLRGDARDALFVSRNGNRISAKTVQYTVKKYLDKAGLSGRGLSTHKLRHTAATLMYQYGNVDIRVLKDILGHSNLGTTQIYTHVSDSQVKSAIDASPLSEVTPKKQ